MEERKEVVFRFPWDSREPGCRLSGVLRLRGEACPDFEMCFSSQDDHHHAKTDAGGRFEAAGVPPGPCEVDLGNAEIVIQVPARAAWSVDLELPRHEIRGRVLDALTRRPLAGVQVDLECPDHGGYLGSTKTGPEGRFRASSSLECNGADPLDMKTTLRFLGATRNVTGSRYVLETPSRRILVDCGLFQEREFRHRNFQPFPARPQDLDAVLLTHAHLDHVGYLPALVGAGYAGPVHATAASAAIAGIVLLDAGRIQEEDAERKKKRHRREKRKGSRPVRPLYTEADAEACIPRFRPLSLGEPLALGPGLTATFHEAGHILGSSMILFEIEQKGERRRLLFSGDVGRWDKPILEDPTLFETADYVVMESTYGDRLHEDVGGVKAGIAGAVQRACREGGNVVVPTFAVERAHEILYVLNRLRMEGRIPPVPVYLDSPMAVRVTEVFRLCEDLFDAEMRRLVNEGKSPFAFPGLHMTANREDSKAINRARGTSVILAGSGMCTGGRIKHHLVHNIEKPGSVVLFTGYQARGTLGRELVEGAEAVRIFGKHRKVKARVEQVQGFSGHADQAELFRWISHLETAPRHVFITHGEPEAGLRFADLLRERLGWSVSVPAYLDRATLA